MESAPLTQSKKPLSASKAGSLSQSKKEKKQKTEDLLASLEAIHKIGVLSDEDFAKKKADILSQQARAKALKVFEAFDTDKSGTIDAKELQQLVFEMGEVMTKSEVNALFAQLKGGKAGATEDITFDEFFGWWSSKPAGDHASGEKSRFLQMKLQSKSYANLIKSKRKEVKAEQVSAAKVDSGVDDGMSRLSFDLTVGDFQAATDAITVTTSQTGGSHRLTVGGVSVAPCFEVLFKILPTATASEIGQVTQVVNNWINIANAFQADWLSKSKEFDAPGFINFSVKTIDGERYFALQGQTPKVSQLEQALTFGLENHLREFEFKFQFDANNFAVKIDAKLTISVEVVDTTLKIAKAMGEDGDELAQVFSAAKILKCVEFELHLKSWKEALAKLLKEDASSSSSSESESESGSSSSEEPIFKKKKSAAARRRRRYASSSSDSESDAELLSERDIEKLATKKMKDVMIGELPFDTFLYETILKNVYPIVRKELKKKLKQKNKGGIMARKLAAGMEVDDFLGLPFLTLLEPTSVVVSVGSVTGKVDFQLPALFQRDPFFYEKSHGPKTLLVRQTLSQSRESFVDHTITVDGQQFKLHKALLNARFPQLALVEEYKGLTAAEFGHVVKFLYGDELPEDFAELYSALRASKILNFTDMSIAIDRRIWFSLSPYNVYERLIYSAGQPTGDESYLINWFLYYASKNKVPFDRRYTRKQKKAAKKARTALLPIAPPGETEKLLAEVNILARVEAERDRLTVVAPKLGLPKSNLRYAMAQLAQNGGDEKICVDLTWFSFHKFVVYPQWSQAQQIVQDRGFVDVPAETFEHVIQYFYSGDRACFSLTDCHWLAGFGKPSFSTAVTGPAGLRVAGRGKREKWSIVELGEATKCGNFSVSEYYISVDETAADRALKHFATFKLTVELAAQQRRANHKLFTK